MITTAKKGVNVAPTSTNGHFVNASKVKEKSLEGRYYIAKASAGESIVIETENHSTVKINHESGAAIFTQKEYNPISKIRSFVVD